MNSEVWTIIINFLSLLGLFLGLTFCIVFINFLIEAIRIKVRRRKRDGLFLYRDMDADARSICVDYVSYTNIERLEIQRHRYIRCYEYPDNFEKLIPIKYRRRRI